jgi:hypothetical protein
MFSVFIVLGNALIGQNDPLGDALSNAEIWFANVQFYYCLGLIRFFDKRFNTHQNENRPIAEPVFVLLKKKDFSRL